jgi:hypothetical protein
VNRDRRKIFRQPLSDLPKSEKGNSIESVTKVTEQVFDDI